MDEYALTMEDWETLVEMRLVNEGEEEVKVLTTTKRDFTRKYAPSLGFPLKTNSYAGQKDTITLSIPYSITRQRISKRHL